MAWKSTPLGVQLLLAFVGLLLATMLVLTYSAHRSVFASLETDARRAVRAAAHARAQMVTQALTARHQRARALLISAESACSEEVTRRRLAWAPDCVHPLINDFRVGERALAVSLTYRGRRIAASGQPVSQDFVAPHALGAVIIGADGRPDIQTRTENDGLALIMRFDGEELDALLSDHAGLREHGEVFVRTIAGEFLTSARYWSSDLRLTPPGAALVEPQTLCSNGPGEIVDIDYRGVRTFHGVAPLAALGDACVDAHMNYAEALAPAEELRAELVARGTFLAVLGALVSLVAAHWIAGPVRRLANTARQLQAGRFDTTVPLAGPAELRELGLAFRGMATDLAELVNREQGARRDAEDANKTKDEFLATVSHELRTPLTAILGWTRMLRTGQLDADRSSRAIQAIERSADVLRRLVEDLLDVSTVTAQRVRMVSAPTNLATVVEKALDSVRPQAVDRSVRIETRFEGDDLVVVGDAERLQQVVWNLVWNAVKFTAAGGWVKVIVRREGGSISLTVTDNGAGIPRGFLPFVFDWFRQADPLTRGPQAGLGLGLGVVQSIVRMHGGSVRAESAGEGQGATFIVTLPAFAGSSEEEQDPDALRPTPLDSVRVLVVDDDDETRDVLKALLEHAGAKVRTASSAADARREMTTAAPDVLISDIMMSNEDGYAFMRSLRASNVTTPAIALTALARREDADSAREAGYHLHLVKPANPEELIAAVATLNEQRASWH